MRAPPSIVAYVQRDLVALLVEAGGVISMRGWAVLRHTASLSSAIPDLARISWVPAARGAPSATHRAARRLRAVRRASCSADYSREAPIRG